jgi:hypothetical protein
MIAQQIDEATDRTLRAPVTDSSSLNLVLPSSSQRAFKYLAFTGSGEPTASEGPAANFIDPSSYGAVGDGVTDDTLALRAAFAAAMPSGQTIILKGTYLISGYIGLLTSLGAGAALHIYCNGPVTINVSPSATPFRNVLFFGCTGATNASIVGGPLTINCSDVAGSAIRVFSGSSSPAGSVNFSSILTVNNCYEKDAAAIYENGGIAVFGQFEQVYMNSPRVVNVNYTNAAAGASFGISVSELTGECLIENPHVENILAPSGGIIGCDGIKIFGLNNAATPKVQTLGKATIQGGTFIDCQGRSVKSQCSDTTVVNPYVKRQFVVAIANAVDFDFQIGGGLLIEPTFEYKLNGGVDPLGASFVPVIFQNRPTDIPQVNKAIGGVLKTEVALRYYAFVREFSDGANSEAYIEGLTVEPLGSLATTVFTISIVTTEMDFIEAKSNTTKIVLRDVSGPMSCYGIGYTGYVSGSVANKFEYEVSGLNSSLTSSDGRVFANSSGSAVTEVKSFLIRNNFNFRDYILSPTFNFNTLVPGCKFTVLTNFVTATNAPSWPSGRYAFIEVLGGPGSIVSDPSTDRAIRVTVTNASTEAVENIFYTFDGGTTWSELLFGTVSGTTKTVTGTLAVDGQLQLGGTIPALAKVSIDGTLPSDTSTTWAVANRGTIPSTTTATYIGYLTGASTQNDPFLLSSYIHYRASQGTITGGSRTAPTSQYGFLASSNLIDAVNNYGFYSEIAAGSGRFNFYSAGTAPSFFIGAIGVDRSTLTIASGAVTATRNYHLLAGEGGIADDLTDITAGVVGQILILRASSDSVTITVKSTGNIVLSGSDMVLDNQYDTIMLLWDGTLSKWLEISRSNNGA